MRVLHLISSGGMYGAEAVILNLSHELRRRGNDSAVASFANASQQLHERALSEGLSSTLVPCKGQLSPESVHAIRDIVRQQRIDILHAHGYKADLYGWAALRGTGVPLVSTCHTWYDNDLAVRIYGSLDRLVLRKYACVVAVSAEVEQRLLMSGVKPERIRRIRNGIDLRPFSAAAKVRDERPSSEVLRVGLVGRLSREKGVDIFIEAAAQVSRSLPDTKFVVVGEGPDRLKLETLVRSLGMEGKLQLLGRRDPMPEVYEGLDLLVSASRQEGLPIALLEGMASGLPLVATTAGEVPSLVPHGQTGVLVATEDHEALAAAITNLLQSRSQRLALGEAARKLVEGEFSVERMTAEYITAYSSVLEN